MMMGGMESIISMLNDRLFCVKVEMGVEGGLSLLSALQHDCGLEYSG